MGIDWWESDPFLTRGGNGKGLECRLRALEEKAGIEPAGNERDRD